MSLGQLPCAAQRRESAPMRQLREWGARLVVRGNWSPVPVPLLSCARVYNYLYVGGT